MSLDKAVKKDIISDPDFRNILIYPFIRSPTEKEAETIETLSNFFVNQMVQGFSNYGFDVTDESFSVDITLIKMLVAASLYRNKRISHSYIDMIDELEELLRESNETKDVMGDGLPPKSDE